MAADNTTRTTGTSRDVTSDETGVLISSARVEGTEVYNRQGEHLGEVHHFMVNKRSGQAEYAVMSFGGFLGMGESYHPLPWKALTYEPGQGGYVVDLDKKALEGAPSYQPGQEPVYDAAFGQRVHGFYGYPYTLV